jgi:hypothetical protein
MDHNPEETSNQTLSNSVVGAFVGLSTVLLVGSLGLWSWMSRWERQYMLLSLRRNPILEQVSESDLLQLVQLGGRFEILPGTLTLPIWKFRLVIVILILSLITNLILVR